MNQGGVFKLDKLMDDVVWLYLLIFLVLDEMMILMQGKKRSDTDELVFVFGAEHAVGV
jgi:hypothetical protein